jgi:hypothetical protein
MVMNGGAISGDPGRAGGSAGGGHNEASSLVGKLAAEWRWRLAGFGAHGAGVRNLVLGDDDAGAAGVAVEPDLALVHVLLVGHLVEPGPVTGLGELLARLQVSRFGFEIFLGGFLRPAGGGGWDIGLRWFLRGSFGALQRCGTGLHYLGLGGGYAPEGPAVAGLAGHCRAQG